MYYDCGSIQVIKGNLLRFYRQFLFAAVLLSLALGCRQLPGAPTSVSTEPSPTSTVMDQREYKVHLDLKLVNEGPGQPSKQNLWLALIRSIPPYQEVLSMEVTPSEYTPITDEYGNRYAEFDFSNHPAGESRIVNIEYRLVVNELAYDLTTCEGATLDVFTQPEEHIESANPQITALVNQLSQGIENDCQQVRSFYDFIGDELVYSFNGNNWGAQAALGPMGADCTEYASLLAALSRAQGIPARYYEGLLSLEDEDQSLARVEHAWVDVYLPGIGWVAMDPTLGRSSIYRETYFAHYTPDHIIVTTGANPSTLRGSSYWTHLYWPGDSTRIHIEAGQWQITPVVE